MMNRCASIDMRGTAIERSQNRQRKLNGIMIDWYFYYVMEPLPLMLQVALLLLRCVLFQFREIDTALASVIL